MFPVGDFSGIAYLEGAIIGIFIGVISGALASIVFRRRVRVSALFIDALFGAIGCLVTAEALWRLYPEFESGFIVASVVAAVLPALHQFYRSIRVEDVV